MKTIEEARELSRKMVNIGKMADKKVVSVITNMDVPLGRNIGNSLEVIEAIDVLRGNGPEDLIEVSVEIASLMVMMTKEISFEEARNEVIRVLNNGEAFNKFKELVRYQGGNVSWIEDTNNFPKAKFIVEIKSVKSGFIKSMDTEKTGKIACNLGAGRETKDTVIDYSAGIKILKKTSEYVNEGETLAIIYTNKEEMIENSKNEYLEVIEFSNEEQQKPKLIYEIIK